MLPTCPTSITEHGVPIRWWNMHSIIAHPYTMVTGQSFVTAGPRPLAYYRPNTRPTLYVLYVIGHCLCYSTTI
jgi:hypothetical protein